MDTLTNLTKATAEKNETEIIDSLKVLITQRDTRLNTVNLIKDLVKFDNNTSILKLSVELVAELARIESNRKMCTDQELIYELIHLLDNKDPDIILHSIRALGNICYENEAACNIINNVGTNKFLTILKEDKDRDSTLITKTSGLLLNLFNMHIGLIRSSLKNGLADIIENILIKYSQEFDKNQTLLTLQVSMLNSVEHYFEDMNITFSLGLCKALIDIFKQSKAPEISIPCLEILHGVCDQEEMKTLLAKEGVCELLFELIEKHRHEVNDEDSRSVLKMACDFIVVVLTGDDCMDFLYNNSEGEVYKSMVNWLDSDDEDLLTSGILGIGNFARKDVHCIEMVNNGISKKLLNILRKYNIITNLEDAVKVQHALLSTLKNLLIPQENKAKILQEGLIEVLYPMTVSNQYLVIFKLLGTFRMAIDGQESTALDLISRKDFIERLVYWCYHSDHLGVRGEIPRLLSWLIKQCHSFQHFNILLEVPDSIKCIVEMISSNHAVMQNEAFYALSLLHLYCSQTNSSLNTDENLENLGKILIDADIGKNLNFILTKYADKMDTPTIENLLTLLERMCRNEEVLDHLKKTELQTPLLKLYANPNICVLEKLDNIKSLVCI